MKKILVVALCALFGQLALADTPQQEKMKACNADAAKKELKGDARKEFMKNCLSAKKEEGGNSQQEKMKTCNAEAKEKALKGDERKKLMKECLSK